MDRMGLYMAGTLLPMCSNGIGGDLMPTDFSGEWQQVLSLLWHFPFIFPHTLPLYVWPLLFLISVIGCLVGTYTAPPTDIEVLKEIL